MKKNVLLIGKKSFLGLSLYKYFKNTFNTKIINFENLNTIKLKKFHFIINCAINKKYIKDKYNSKYDFDLKIAKLTKNFDSKLIFLSTRKIYKPKPNIFENGIISCRCNYSKNKLKTEKKIYKLLKNRVLILRVANLIGISKVYPNRKLHMTFLDVYKQNVKKGIVFDNKNIFKDFLPLSIFNKIIEQMIKKNLSGIYNISLGQKVYLKDIINWLNFYNKKELKIVNYVNNSLFGNRESFFLNNKKLKKKIGIKISLNDLKRECKKISKSLFYEKK